MSKLFLLPQPQKVAVMEGVCAFEGRLTLVLPEALKGLSAGLATLGQGIFEIVSADGADDGAVAKSACGGEAGAVVKSDSAVAPVNFVLRPELDCEAYGLKVQPDGIFIEYGQDSGAFYGLMTLRQLVMQAGAVAGGSEMPDGCAAVGVRALPCCDIEDYPQVKNRGYMLDISRGKVPAMASLKQLVDLLASFKFNHLELYIEGFSFMYASFEKYCDEKSALTPEELRELDTYCRERFLDLVPNQNSFGHMGPWLAQPEFRQLAEAPDGWQLGSATFPPTTLDARDDAPMELLTKMCGDLLPNFTSRYFNVDMDEPFDMGLGKNKEFVQTHGKEQLYLMHARKMHQLVTLQGKTMMMWGDVVEKYPQLLSELPEDIIIMDWGYEAEFPVARHAKLLHEHGRRFYLCPGTNTWSSFTGMTDNMWTCITNTVDAACTYGAEGVMLTDWGDGGHLQYLPASYAPMVLTAGLCWNNKELSEAAVARAMDDFIFMDGAHILGQAFLDAGKYERLEEFSLPCRSMASVVSERGRVSASEYMGAIERMIMVNKMLCQKEVVAAYAGSYEERRSLDVPALMDYMDEIATRLSSAAPGCLDGPQIVRELINAMSLVKVLTRIRQLCLDGENDGSLANTVDAIMVEHEALWKLRNKESGLKIGLQNLKNIKESLLD